MKPVLRGLAFATVIIACAGTGFFASRLWPLPTSLTPTLKVASSDATRPKEQVLSTSQPLGDVKQPPSKHEAPGPTKNPDPESFVLLNPGTTEQPRELEQTNEIASQRTPQAGPVSQPPKEKALPRQSASRQGKQQTEADPPQLSASSIGSQRDAAMRDYMSHNPPFKH